MGTEKSQGAAQQTMSENAGKKDDRKRQYAFLVYPSSAGLPSDWLDRLAAEHIEALVSPLHDKDVEPDGKQKKPHYHVMLMFEGKKSQKQIDEIRERCLGPNYNKGMENIGSMRGYARYLLHLDNPEKAQYSRDGIKALSGADFDAITVLPSDDVKALGDIMDYIREHEVRYFSDFMIMCRNNNPDWFRMLVSRKSYVVIEFIKSEAVRARDAKNEKREALYKKSTGRAIPVLVDPETGEVLEDRR